jgi:penicillin amidase
LVSAAMDRTLNRISAKLGSNPNQWHWGAWHPAISSHKPFGKVPGLNALFDVRVESPGDLFTVNVGQYWANDKKEPFANRHAASMRAIYDLSSEGQGLFIYQTGQSGHVFSTRSRDMANQWARGHYRSLSVSQPAQVHSLRLIP